MCTGEVFCENSHNRNSCFTYLGYLGQDISDRIVFIGLALAKVAKAFSEFKWDGRKVNNNFMNKC